MGLRDYNIAKIQCLKFCIMQQKLNVFHYYHWEILVYLTYVTPVSSRTLILKFSASCLSS